MDDIGRYFTEHDFAELLVQQERFRVAGFYNPADPWTIFISRGAAPTEDFQKQIIAHEFVHLEIFTSTAYGHIQQLFAHLLKKTVIPDDLTSVWRRWLAMLNESSWEVHEGVATLGAYLATHPFTYSLVQHETFEDLPPRYRHAASILAMAVGALLPYEWFSLGRVAAKAVAQFCLNTSIIRAMVPIWESFRERREWPNDLCYEHLSQTANHPGCRLLQLVGRLYSDRDDNIGRAIGERFRNAVKTLPSVKIYANGSVEIRPDSEDEAIMLQDLFGTAILVTLDEVIPGFMYYTRPEEVAKDYATLCRRWDWLTLLGRPRS